MPDLAQRWRNRQLAALMLVGIGGCLVELLLLAVDDGTHPQIHATVGTTTVLFGAQVVTLLRLLRVETEVKAHDRAMRPRTEDHDVSSL